MSQSPIRTSCVNTTHHLPTVHYKTSEHNWPNPSLVNTVDGSAEEGHQQPHLRTKDSAHPISLCEMKKRTGATFATTIDVKGTRQSGIAKLAISTCATMVEMMIASYYSTLVSDNLL